MRRIQQLSIFIFLLGSTFQPLLARDNLSIHDFDGDGISDTVYIDTLSYLNVAQMQSRIVCKLSTQSFAPILSGLIYYDVDNEYSASITVFDNGFSYLASGMRMGEDDSFSYEKSTGRIRLTSIYYWDYGNVVNDGKRDIVVDLLSGKVSGDTYFYDYQKEKLIKTKISQKRNFPPVYLEDFNNDIYLLEE